MQHESAAAPAGGIWAALASHSSDVTEGSAGNGERLGFLYDSDRVQPPGTIGEIVLPPIEADPACQFARTPYFGGFTRAGTEFTLASVHVVWGKNAAERLPEVIAFAVDEGLGGPAQRLESEPYGLGRLQPGSQQRRISLGRQTCP